MHQNLEVAHISIYQTRTEQTHMISQMQMSTKVVHLLIKQHQYAIGSSVYISRIKTSTTLQNDNLESVCGGK